MYYYIVHFQEKIYVVQKYVSIKNKTNIFRAKKICSNFLLRKKIVQILSFSLENLLKI